MADKFFNNQKIYVEADYENILVVDPNKVVDKSGAVQERLVNHEELVIYANLETKIIPRTKLANGTSFDQAVQNIRVASMNGDDSLNVNFLKPRGKKYFDTSWSDQITGEGSTEGLGANQTTFEIVGTGENQRRVKKSINNEDTQLFGIQQITVKNNLSYTPQVSMTMIDVQGRALFEQGENSPYSAFMQMPYPLFTLTLKGYYGKALRYELMLKEFNARFDPSTGNYIIETNFISRPFALLNDIRFDYMLNIAKIGPTQIETTKNTITPQTQPSIGKTSSTKTTKGREKLNEVYTAYKSKGLIDENFPHLSIDEMRFKMDRFERYVMDSYGQEDMSVLNDIQEYSNTLSKYKNSIYPKRKDNWFEKYVDETNVFILNNQSQTILYRFKKELDTNQINDAIDKLNAIIVGYNKELNTNTTFGSNGKYKIGTEEKRSDINVNIKKGDIIKILPNLDQINFNATYQYQKDKSGTEEEVASFKNVIEIDFNITTQRFNSQTNEVEVNQSKQIFLDFGKTFKVGANNDNTFLSKINSYEKQFVELKTKIEEELTKKLSEKVQQTDIGLGFKPSIKNVAAVLCANADAFLRYMEEIHENSWNKRNDPIRLKSIISPDKSFGIDNKNEVEISDGTTTKNTSVVYPWPQYFEKEYDEKGQEIFVTKYPGQPKVLSKTQGFKFDVWPEIKFVEDYIAAAVTRVDQVTDTDFNNELKVAKYISFNPMEFPYGNKPYSDLSEVSYFYEIFERSFLSSYYTKFSEQNSQSNELYSILGDFEILNIQETVKDSPSLAEKLKKYSFSYNSYVNYLRSISNNGEGLSWNQYKIDYFSKEYIQRATEKSFGLYNVDSISENSQIVEGSSNSIEKLENFLSNNDNNKISFLVKYPFSNLEKIKNYLIDGENVNSLENAFDTSQVYSFLKNKKTISSFKIEDDNLTKKPIIFFEWIKNTLSSDQTTELVDDGTISLRNFYNVRNLQKYFLTEGSVNYGNNYNDKYNVTENQTTSILNTPYFINSIISGVEKEKQGNVNPHATTGYLVLNTLPLTTLHEKLKKYENDLTTEQSYHFAVLNKFASIHKIPYLWVLKYGSVWYRYKKHKEDGVDILSEIWNDINYKKLYDPSGSDEEKPYTITDSNGNNITIILKKTVNDGATETESITLNNGFYPKVINDFYYFFTKKDVISNYTSNGVNSDILQNNIKVGRSSDPLFFEKGYDLSNTNRILSINNWSTYIDITNNLDFGLLMLDELTQTDSGDTGKLLIIPSCGYRPYNQSINEFFNTNKVLKSQIVDSNALYNGTFRSLWGTPNYGFFDTTDLKKPRPNQYIKTNKNPFGLSDKQEDYHSIEEIFSIFSKDMLDEFEQHFLNFCKRNDEIKELVLSTKNKNDVDLFGTDSTKYKTSLFDVLEDFFIVNKPTLSDNFVSDINKIAEKQIESTKQLRYDLLEKDVILKIGNPGGFNRRVFDSFSSDENFHPFNKIDFGKFDPTTILQNTDAIIAMSLYIGDYENSAMISNAMEFFQTFDIEFSENNVKILSDIIKIYSSQKINNPNLTRGEFEESFNDYLLSQQEFHENILNHIFVNLNRKLPDIVISEEEQIISKTDGNVSKNEIYLTFKKLNDSWIAGQDFKSKTIFEDILIFDKANRPIGDQVLIDVTEFRGYLRESNANTSLYSLLSQLFDMSYFTCMPVPSYVNFYGRDSRVKEGEPIPSDVANDVFGTFMEVDVRGSSAKILAIFNGNESETVDQKNNSNYVFGDDSFDLKKAQLNPLKDNLDGVVNFSDRNRVVGFSVDFGSRNQGVFKSISIDMKQRKNTSISFKVQEDMANQYSGQEVAQQSQSLYNYYRGMSYNCQVQSFGNIMIQPTMYFHLRHVPIFHGTYKILNVNHTINDNEFNTTFEGVRLPIYQMEVPDKLVMSVNRSLIEKYRESINNIKESNTTTSGQTTTQSVTQNTDNVTPTTDTSKCINVTKYPELEFVDSQITNSELSDSELFDMIRTVNSNNHFIAFVFGLKPSDNKFFNHSITLIRTDRLWGGQLSQYFSGQVCINTPVETSIASFNSLEDSIRFLSDRFSIIFSDISPYLRPTIIQTNLREATALADIWYSAFENDFFFGSTPIDIIQEIDQRVNSNATELENYTFMVNKFMSIYNQLSLTT